MADERRIVIELVAKNQNGATGEEIPGEETTETQKNQKVKAITTYAVKQTIQWASREILTAAEFEVGRYLNLTEDYKTRISYSNAQETINKVVGLGNAIISGAITGAQVGGPWGAVAGAVIGGGTAIATETFNLVRQYNEQTLSLLIDDKQTQYARTRMGLIDNGRGTLN